MVQESGPGSACKLNEALPQLVQISPTCLSTYFTVCFSWNHSSWNIRGMGPQNLLKDVNKVQQFMFRDGRHPGLTASVTSMLGDLGQVVPPL